MMIGLGRYASMDELRAWIERDVVGEREDATTGGASP
jgi:hypothetical protein